MEQQLKAVCCVCGVVYRDGPTDENGRVSHGYCPIHAHYVMNQMKLEDMYDGEDNKAGQIGRGGDGR